VVLVAVVVVVVVVVVVLSLKEVGAAVTVYITLART